MNFKELLPKNVPFLGQKQTNEYFFALNISSSKVEGAVWGIEGRHLRIISTAAAQYSSEDELIEAANYALDDALADFQPEPTKVLFGVPDSWLQDENLKSEYSKILQRLVKELDVEPMAYVSSVHAISHLIQKQQGVPVTAVLVEVGDPLIVSVVKAGKILGVKWHKRSGNLPDDIEKLLMQFSEVEVLPSKIHIYGSEKLDKYKEELLSYSWMAQLPFLHLPKIEEMGMGSGIRSVCLAGAFELNPEVIYTFDRAPLELEDSAQPKNHITRPASHIHHEPTHRGEGGGFKNTGFVVGDIKHSSDQAEDEQLSYNQEDDINHEYMVSEGPFSRTRGDVLPQGAHSGGSFADTVLSVVSAPLGFLGSLGLASRTPRLAIFVLILLLALLAGAFVLLPKAKVAVFVDMRLLEKDSQVIADPEVTVVDEDNKKIPGKIIKTTVSGSGKGSATGKKKVGDPAKGTVVIYNKTNAQKTFSSGTVLVGPSNLKFTLDTNVNIASQSAVDGGISFGKATANVTATDIGPDGNLPAGKELSIQNQSSDSYGAKIDQAFSGGVSRDVTVVTSEDQKKLLAQVASDLRKKAKDELQVKLEGDMKILEESLTEQVTKSSYTKNVNDQASEFTLNLSADYKGTAYSEKDLKSIVSKLVETNVPQGFELDLSQTETQANVSKVEKDGKLVFQAKFRAKLMPKFDPDQIKKEIAGKSKNEAAEKLKHIENVIGSSIEITPALPGPLQRLPFLPQNISLEITAK